MAIYPKKQKNFPHWYITLRRLVHWVTAKFSFGALALIKLLPADPAIDLCEKSGRWIGMRISRSQKARENLKRAFPEKSDAEIEEILRNMWGSLSRTAAEFAFLDKIFDFDYDNPTSGRFEIAGIENFLELRDTQGPAICFTAHTANWEILPVASAAYGLNITSLFRPPNNPYIAERLLAARTTAMGHLVPSRAGASWALGDILHRGGKVGLLVDQYYKRGVPISFFGRKTLANPLLARLARQYDCPVYPARCIRLPGGKFRIELQDRLELPRDAEGKVDIAELTQQVNDVIESWIREYPEQWLWLHNRWRLPKKWQIRLGLESPAGDTSETKNSLT